MDRPANDNGGYFQPHRPTPSMTVTPSTPDYIQSQNGTLPRQRPQHPRLPSVRISRFSVPQLQSTQQPSQSRNNVTPNVDETEMSSVSGRPRNTSDPTPHVHFPRQPVAKVASTATSPQTEQPLGPVTESQTDPAEPPPPRLAKPGRFRSAMGLDKAYRAENPKLPKPPNPKGSTNQQEYDAELVDWLDIVDPEVSTLSTLTNVQNSLFIPDLGRLLNRRPTYALSHHGDVEKGQPQRPQAQPKPTAQPQSGPATPGTIQEESENEEPYSEDDGGEPGRQPRRKPSLRTIGSTLSESRFAVLPHGLTLEGWSEEDKRELNDHVRHMLHSRRSRFGRAMRGFGQYVRRPLGFFVTVYATLITLFGLAWVLFLIGWINVGGKQLYMINVIDNVMVALFAIMGDGLAPFRAVDTYHMIYIAHYHHLTWKLREKKAMPRLQDHNDLPVPAEERPADLEAPTYDHEAEDSVLTQKQQDRLIHHQTKFAKSHTFYKPHETTTHYAFPLRLLVAVVVLLDFHSLFQIALGTCTWSIPYKVRPFALTTVILCCSICCNITAGVIIMIGDRRTRKKDVLERMARQELTEEAIGKVEKKRKERQSVDQPRESQGSVEAGDVSDESSTRRERSYEGV